MDDNFNFNLAGYDPFDEPLDSIFDENEELVLDDVYFEADYFTLNLTHSPIYLNFNSELNVRKNSKNISVFLS